MPRVWCPEPTCATVFNTLNANKISRLKMGFAYRGGLIYNLMTDSDFIDYLLRTCALLLVS